MSKTVRKRANRRGVDRHGKSVDLTNYTKSEDDYTQDWSETTDSPHTINARVQQRRGVPRPSRDVRETGDIEADFSLFIRDDADGIDNIRDGGGQGASTFDTDQDGTDDLRVLLKYDEDNGIVRLDAERI